MSTCTEIEIGLRTATTNNKGVQPFATLQELKEGRGYGKFVSPAVLGDFIDWVKLNGLPGGMVDMWVPDYANMESTNRITTVTGSWTVDRDGFVFVGGMFGGSGEGISFKVNGKSIFNANSGDSILVVKKGDVVQGDMTGSIGNIHCNFIPPIIINASGGGDGPGYPDYANAETVNRIAMAGGSWSVEHDGFVSVWGMGSSGVKVQVLINGGVATRIDLQQSGMTHTISDVLPVKAGDVVQLDGPAGTSGTNIGCYFIPKR